MCFLESLAPLPPLTTHYSLFEMNRWRNDQWLINGDEGDEGDKTILEKTE